MTILLSLVIGLISFISLLIAEMDVYQASVLALMGVVTIILIGIADIYIFDAGFDNTTVRSEKRKLRGRFLVSLAVSPVVYVVTWILFTPLTGNAPFLWLQLRGLIILLFSSWIMNGLIIMLYKYVFLRHSSTQSEIENLQLKSLVSETANQVLKQQIHPHFLFNVLNTIKSLYKQDIQQGEEYLVHLANFLRASISGPTSKTVSVDAELQLCRDYIAMQRIRFGDALTYKVDLPPEVLNQRFIPYFSVQLLLENAIKHNVLTEEAPLNISVTKEGEYIKVANNLQQRTSSKESSTMQGLFNLTERYKLISGDEVHISQEERCFSVKIKLLSDEYSNN
ncbi:histidine kinase [Flammeovirgaceae bacterium SG7u.132]|nr:histidine kinase [Flammeovirgaceae bacterium SG7u.132]